MNIFNAGSLEVYAGTTSIWSLSGNQGNQWQSAEIETSDLDNQQVSRTIYWLVHAFIAPSDEVPRRSRDTKLRVRDNHIPTDLVQDLYRKCNVFRQPLPNDNYRMIIKLATENIT